MIAIWPQPDGIWPGALGEANELLVRRHYLGPTDRALLVLCQWAQGQIVACQVWAWPTSRKLPNDGTWLELSRWCLTPEAGPNAGSRMHRAAVQAIRARLPSTTTLVSYSDRRAGHTGSLYRACNWRWRPTWHRLRPPPTGGASWDGVNYQEPKDRWIFEVRPDPGREAYLKLDETYARQLAEIEAAS